MIFRIRFAKYGVVKFIGHLDVMRYFQKAVRRSGLPIKYSQGFNPHQLMVFAQPLGVGITSDGEYMDIETEDRDLTGAPLDAGRIAEILGSALTEGFEIVSVRQIPWAEGTKHPENAMSLVKGADYIMSLKDGYNLVGSNESLEKKENPDESGNERIGFFKEKLAGFLGQDTIIVSKKSKSGEKEMDIKPYIYAAAAENNSILPDFMYEISEKGTDRRPDKEVKKYVTSGTAICQGSVHADKYSPDIRFFFRLSAGSEVNIKPELVLESFLDYCNLKYEPMAFQTHRANLFSDVEKGEGL